MAVDAADVRDPDRHHASMLGHIDDSFIIPSSSLKLCEPIGQGHFGVVMRAVWNGCTTVAAKIISTDRNQLGQLQAFEKEVNLCVYELYRCCKDPFPILIILAANSGHTQMWFNFLVWYERQVS